MLGFASEGCCVVRSFTCFTLSVKYYMFMLTLMIHIHPPTTLLTGKMQRTLEGLLEDPSGGTESEDITSVVLTDTVGQRIRVNVENTLGEYLQSDHVAVYICNVL